MSIADRALAAYEADTEARRLEQEAKEARTLGEAQQVILFKAEELGIDLTAEQVTGGPVEYKATVEVTADLRLEFKYRPVTYGDQKKLEVVAVPSDELYYDQPAGTTFADLAGRGYTFKCYGLDRYPVTTLAQIGAALKRAQVAREHWRKKHD